MISNDLEHRARVPALLLKVLRLYRLWPSTGNLNGLTSSFYITTIITYCAVGFPIAVPVAFHLFLSKSYALEVIFYDINILIVYVTIVLMLFIYLRKLHKIVSLERILHRMFFESEKQTKLIQFQEMLIKIALLVITILIMSYTAFRILEEENCKERLSTEDGKYYCGLMLACILPPGADNKFVKIIISIVQMIASLILYYALIAIFCLCVCTMQQVIFNIKLLRESTELVRSEQGYYYYKAYIKYFVISQLTIMRTASMLDDITYYIHFVHVTNCSVIYMLELIDAYVNRNLVSAIHLIGWFIPSAYIASLGQSLIDESEALSEALYRMEWYEMDISLRLDIMLMLFSTQKPIVMHAGPFFFLSLSTFLQLIRGTFSYCAMVINLTEQEKP